MTELTRHASPVQGPQGLAWDGETMWVTSAANGRLYAVDPQTWSIRREFVPPSESLGITYTGSDFRLILAPSIDEPDLERDHRYVYKFSPDAGFAECFVCPDNSGSFLAYADGTLYLSQAWDMKLIELDEGGSAVREVQLERRPVGMTIEDGAFYLVTVDEEWGDGRFERLGIGDDPSSIRTLRSLPFKPRSVAFDGEQFWTADRNNHAIVSFTLKASPRRRDGKSTP
jgi:DNA-binding beta-propeller fold protein YncE